MQRTVTSDANLQRVRPTTFEQFYSGHWQEIYRPLAVLFGLDLTSVARTADGSIWFGTGLNGVTRYQRGTRSTSGVELELTGVPQSADQWPASPSTTDAPVPTTSAP